MSRRAMVRTFRTFRPFILPFLTFLVCVYLVRKA